MRRTLSFLCEGNALAATLDEADGSTGLLIIQGGNEIRVGAHRGMAKLAAAVAGQGYPVLRFDRRGIGDSEGENQGYMSCGPDIAAAVEAFRAACARLERVVGFGNCDAATALVLHKSPVDALILSNPWVVEPVDDLPPPAAIKGHYARRMRDPAAWAALLTGKVDLRGIAKGLGRIAAAKEAGTLAESFARALAVRLLPTTIVLAARDGTALAFDDEWKSTVFNGLRDDPAIRLETVDSASHSYAGRGDFEALLEVVLARLAA
ncbi:MAG: hydrolase 1, exosortase A system-associated [Sphingomonadaceae bacterium]|nr:hydrolase 1, exosortase A system-associated [Sphingomonadaceae bacterium]